MTLKLIKRPKVTPLAPVSESSPKYTDLREVMDYKRPLSIFYSGVEYESYLDILYNLGIRNFLMSYEYLKGKGHGQIKKYSDMHLFIDSGAYTYITNPEFESYTVEQWEEQIQKYLSWAKKHKDSIFAIADLDLQYLVGNEKVYEWRKKYFEPFMLETGIPVCFIYHEEGDEQWEYMCKRYPYVGLSLNVDGNSIDEADLREKFRVAEKYNTLVQGMASTRTSMLTEYPFYTVDSTTWNVGLKYGEISVWNNNKMSRIKKQDFETKAFPVISRYDYPFNLDLIREEDKTELIKVNAYAFVQAEKYIHDRLKSRMYWFKARAKKRSSEDINSVFPTEDWFYADDFSDAKKYAEEMNVNPDLPDLVDVLNDMTAVMNWDNPDYSKLVSWYRKEENQHVIDELHDLYVNRIVPDFDTKIQDLQKFFTECICGENDKLLQMGTNFDRIVKERSDYIEDDVETELVDLTPEELKVKLIGILPEKTDAEGMPEITDLDKEIFSQTDVIPTFDEKGRFVKGQVAVRKPKKVYSSKYPKIACDTCYAAQKCPEYKAGHVCAFSKMFDRFDTRDVSDIVQAMQGMVNFSLSRMQRAMIIENMTGTFDPNVTSFINQNMSLLRQMNDLYTHASSEVLRQTRTVYANGTEEQTTEITNPKSGGILERIFGSQTDTTKEESKDSLNVVKTE